MTLEGLWDHLMVFLGVFVLGVALHDLDSLRLDRRFPMEATQLPLLKIWIETR